MTEPMTPERLNDIDEYVVSVVAEEVILEIIECYIDVHVAIVVEVGPGSAMGHDQPAHDSIGDIGPLSLGHG